MEHTTLSEALSILTFNVSILVHIILMFIGHIQPLDMIKILQNLQNSFSQLLNNARKEVWAYLVMIALTTYKTINKIIFRSYGADQWMQQYVHLGFYSQQRKQTHLCPIIQFMVLKITLTYPICLAVIKSCVNVPTCMTRQSSLTPI